MDAWCWNTFNILIGTNAKMMSDGPDRVPYKVVGNMKLYDITEQFRLAAKGTFFFFPVLERGGIGWRINELDIVLLYSRCCAYWLT